jgi:putative transposase
LDRTARTALVSAENKELTMTRQSELCHVNRSSVYRQKKEPLYGESDYNLSLMRRIDELHLENPSWGSRRIAVTLRREGMAANRKRIQRLMQKMDLCALYPGPNLSRRLHAEYRHPYLLRNLKIDHEDHVWGIDISYLPLKTGFMYLFVIIDWYTRQIVDYELSYSLEKTFVFRCLKRALSRRKPEIINSDQGSHFTNPDYIKLLEDRDIKISMDGKRQALDNIITERFFRSIKYEDLYINEYGSPAELIRAVDRYIRFYNSNRPHQSLAYKTPNEVSRQMPSYDLAA